MNGTPSSGLARLRIRHLTLLETLADTGSVHKAAKALHVSQPAASAMLKELEEVVGARLFDRTRRGAVPNAHGGAAIARVRAILGELAMLHQEVQAARPVQVLRLGTLTHAFYGVLQRVLREFLARTDCRIDLREGSVMQVLEMLQRNELDCMIGRLPAPSVDPLTKRGFFYQPLYHFEMCVLAAASHPLARTRKMAFRDLAAFSWVLPREGANSRYTLASAFAAQGLPEPRVRLETSSFVFALQLLAVSDWLTVAPREAGLTQQRLGLARVLPVKLPNLLGAVSFIAPRSAMANRNVSLLWEVIRGAKLS